MMTLKELKSHIDESDNKESLNNLTVSFKLPQENLKIDFKGVIDIYRYFKRQYKGWESMGDDIPEILTQSKQFSAQLLDSIEELISNEYRVQENINKLKNAITTGNSNYHNNNRNINISKIFTFESSETAFLLQLSKDFPNRVAGAAEFLNKPESLKLDRINTDSFLGYLQAYEFRFPEEQRTKRRTSERASLNSLKGELSKIIDEGKSDLDELFSTTIETKKENFDTWFNDIRSAEENWSLTNRKESEALLQNSKTAQNGWLEKSQEEFKNFKVSASKKITELENLYQEKLKLEAPAQYWRDRATTLKKEGRRWLIGLILAAVVSIFSLAVVLFFISDGTLKDLFSETGSAIRWSIVFVTFVSFLAYAIRVFAKLTFSAYHLFRDAEEREQLAYVYLALKKEKNIDDTERHLIMQSLFSRADSGLLRDDASPTMPGGSMIEKLMGGK